MNTYEIKEEPIPINDYRHLRVACGLSNKSIEAATIGLNHTLHSVVVYHAKKAIGMGRIIGDGGCFCQVVDICVLPNYQGQGIGKLVMKNLMDFVEKKLPATCYISLIADGDASFLYEKFGFKPTLPDSSGMYYKR